MFKRLFVPTITPYKLIDDAMSLLDERGWKTGSWGSELSSGPYCVEGAIERVLNERIGECIHWREADYGGRVLPRYARKLNGIRREALDAILVVANAEEVLRDAQRDAQRTVGWGIQRRHPSIPNWNDHQSSYKTVRPVLEKTKSRLLIPA